MTKNILLKSQSISELVPTMPPRNTIAYYTISVAKSQYIYFNKEQLLLMYHLLRFGYFDREIIHDLYASMTTKVLRLPWLQSCIGNRNYPISSDERKDGRKKIYYINTQFAKWLLNIFPEHKELYEMTRVTEFDNSLYSIQSNRLTGGRPRTINTHDLKTRRFVAKVARAIFNRANHPSLYDLNLQYSFPSNRHVITILPDAALFVKGACYYIEYDRNTEAHYQLLGKVVGYFSEDYYKHSEIYFIFDELGKPKGTDYTTLHPRVARFMSNVRTVYYKDTEKTYEELLAEQDVSLFVSPAVNGVSQMAYHILKELHLLPLHTENISVEALQKNGGLPYDIISVEEEGDEVFDCYVIVQNDSFEVVKIPLVYVSYIPVDLNTQLKEWFSDYRQIYNHIGIIFDKGINEQFYPLPHPEFFIPLFI